MTLDILTTGYLPEYSKFAKITIDKTYQNNFDKEVLGWAISLFVNHYPNIDLDFCTERIINLIDRYYYIEIGAENEYEKTKQYITIIHDFLSKYFDLYRVKQNLRFIGWVDYPDLEPGTFGLQPKDLYEIPFNSICFRILSKVEGTQ